MREAVVRIHLTADQIAAIERTRSKFTAADLKRIATQAARDQETFAQMANAATLDEQERIAGPWWRQRVERPRVLRRIPTRRVATMTTTATLKPRAREYRPVESRRASSSSPTSGSDPGDSEPPLLPRITQRWRRVEVAWVERQAAELDGQWLDAVALDDERDGLRHVSGVLGRWLLEQRGTVAA